MQTVQSATPLTTCLFVYCPTHSLQEQRVKSVLIGRLCPGDSFGETTVLKSSPMSWSVITDTHVQIGTISTLDVYGKFSSTSLL